MWYTEKSVNSSLYIAFVMAAIAGFSDVFGFITLHEIFTAHITGNLVIAISYALYHTPGILPRIVAIPIFILAAFIVTTIIELFGISKQAFRYWLALETLLFLALMITVIAFHPSLTVTSVSFLFIAMIPVTAMAIHNTLMKTFLRSIPVYTVMTGNLSQFIISLTALLLGKHTHIKEDHEQLILEIKKFGTLLLGFIVGGAVSLLYVVIGFYAILFLMPFLILAIIIA